MHFFLIPLLESSLLQDNVAFVLCLDTLGNGDNLYLHVSKPPKEGTPQHAVLRELQTVTHTHTAELHKLIEILELLLGTFEIYFLHCDVCCPFS